MKHEQDIIKALKDLHLRVEQNHTQEMNLVREASRQLERANIELMAEVEQAVRVYREGRDQLAKKLVEAAELVGQGRFSQIPEAPPKQNGAGAHTLEQADPLKIFAQTNGSAS